EKAAAEPTMADFSLEEDDFDFEPGPISTNNESDILIDDPFDPCDYEARMQINLSKTMVNFSKIFTEEYEQK
ncbi:MAG: hypothetical protein ACKVH9_05265, partial [Rhodobacterales bacterium]